MFPKILHQTWRTTDLSGVPEFDCCSRSWRAHHPEYEYRLWDDQANARFVEENLALLDQNELFIRKRIEDCYRRIPGNEDDRQIYEDVCCTTEKPAEYFEDSKLKFVADWHFTPRQYYCRREYEQAGEDSSEVHQK
jgi:hypothetical protein